MTTYPGGKAGAGVYQRLINLMPPHQTYIEPFLGAGAVMRAKRPADLNIGIDIDPDVLFAFRFGKPPVQLEIYCEDALYWLAHNPEYTNNSDTLIYLDPPYLLSTRGGRRYYTYEMDDDQHLKLLDLILGFGCMVMISGYWSKMYAVALDGWRVVNFQAMTRGGSMATEYVWLNFPEPKELHDYRYLGDNFRQRERIKRLQHRWRQRLAKMPAQERYALLSVLNGEQAQSLTAAAIDGAGDDSELIAGPGDNGQDRQP